MIDYTDLLNTMQKVLAEQYRQAPDLLNIPGRSLACRLDLFYFLAIQPGFSTFLARHCGVLPRKTTAALVHTGDIITAGPDKSHTLRLDVVWDNWGRPRRARVLASLIHASFIDRALLLYAGIQPLTTSGLRIAAAERSRVAPLLAGKTELSSLAFAP